MWLHINIECASTGAGHRKYTHVPTINTYLRRAEAQEKSLTTFAQQAHGLTHNHGLSATATDPAGKPPIALNKRLGSWFGRSWSFAPDDSCQHKWLSGLRQLISKLKQAVGHIILQQWGLPCQDIAAYPSKYYRYYITIAHLLSQYFSIASTTIFVASCSPTSCTNSL